MADLLQKRHFSLRANKKTIEGEQHPDRNAQFEQINQKVEEFKKQGNPEISVDCKKKELLGSFKNNGREWQAKGEDTCVNVYDNTPFFSSSILFSAEKRTRLFSAFPELQCADFDRVTMWVIHTQCQVVLH